MATASHSVYNPIGATIYIDTDTTSTIGTAFAGSKVLYMVEVDNTNNTSTAAYLKLFNTTGSVTAGTTVNDESYVAPKGKKITYVFGGGVTFGTGLKYFCVTDGGGTAGTTSPSNDVTIRILHS